MNSVSKTRELATLLPRIREAVPLVQCITNYVAMNITANVLLAAGASPAMVHAADEVGEFATLANAIVINIGTLSTDWISGMKIAAETARTNRKPWVLDPVAHFATGFRRKTVAELLELRPTIIRGNASEIIALSGGVSAGSGVDSGDEVVRSEDLARSLAQRRNSVVAVTGPVDFVTDGERVAWVSGGSPFMPKVTALGCSLSALCGAFVAVSPDAPFRATVAALIAFAAAGALAAESARGPGSFSVHFLDALAALDVSTLEAHADLGVR